MTSSARPFCKAVGGKTKLLPQILELLPKHTHLFYEPFIGGGAVFWELANQSRIDFAVINDKNMELINVYDALRSNTEVLFEALERHKIHDSETYYYEQRTKSWKSLSPGEAAARFIYMNKTCFNGLYRVNKSGGFNVPYANHPQKFQPDYENLRACATILNRLLTSINHEDFASITSKAMPGDAVYFDPPYLPLKDGSFESYTKDGFTLNDHVRLANSFRKLHERGVDVVLSNSDTETTRELYKGFQMIPVQVRRSINRDGKGRGPVGELLIVSKII